MNENPGKHYLYALLYLEEIEIREKLDSAFYFVKLSRRNIYSVDAKENEELIDLNITTSAIDSLEDVIDSVEFQFVLEKNNIDEYRKYFFESSTNEIAPKLLNTSRVNFLLRRSLCVLMECSSGPRGIRMNLTGVWKDLTLSASGCL